MSKNNSGQTLLEMVMALAVVGIVLVALVSLSTRSLGNTTFSANKSRATRLTQEASEWIRAQRDADWANLSGRVTAGGEQVYCLPNLVWPGGTGACDPNTQKVKDNSNDDTEFVREVTLRGMDTDGAPGLDTVSVGVVTYWFDGVGTREARTTTLLSNWKN